jgi:hypothetical protein
VALDDSGIAQGGMIDTVDGDWYALLFQDHGAVGRIPFLVPVTWKDGWPIFGKKGEVPPEMCIPVRDSKLLCHPIVASDEFYQGSKRLPVCPQIDDENQNLSYVWQWNHNPDHHHWSLAERPGYVRLTNGIISTSILDTRNTLTQRTFGPESSGSVALEIGNMKDGDVAGLAAFQENYGFVGVKMCGESTFIVMVNGHSESLQEVERIPLIQDRIYFKVDLDYKDRIDQAHFYYSLNGVAWKAIGNTLHMAYTLPHFMGYRFALFNYATKTTDGFVDFDYFRVNDQITGTDLPETILEAKLGDVADVVGAPNVEFNVPVTMDALPEGAYTSISASFNIPAIFDVTGVTFNTDNIVGDGSYAFADHRLQVEVTGEDVYFANHSSQLFVTINLKVNDFVTTVRTEVIRTDDIHVEG